MKINTNVEEVSVNQIQNYSDVINIIQIQINVSIIQSPFSSLMINTNKNKYKCGGGVCQSYKFKITVLSSLSSPPQTWEPDSRQIFCIAKPIV